MTVYYSLDNSPYLAHHGVMGMKWGVRKRPRYVPHPRAKKSSSSFKTTLKNTLGGTMTRGEREKANRKMIAQHVIAKVRKQKTAYSGKQLVHKYLENHSKTKVSSIVLTTAGAVGAAFVLKKVAPGVVGKVAEKAGANPMGYYRVAQRVGGTAAKLIGKGAVSAGAGALAMKVGSKVYLNREKSNAIKDKQPASSTYNNYVKSIKRANKAEQNYNAHSGNQKAMDNWTNALDDAKKYKKQFSKDDKRRYKNAIKKDKSIKY